ncbi:hypothetical protein [Streptomyces viridosporus]|uniref:hypothetical protein n=1 Tax=Streptomyces viridosporus TaxID=67581 RepID=UPI0036FE151B
MIRNHYRLQSGAAQFGATGSGPFGVRPADDHRYDDDREREHTVHRAKETST